MRSCVSRSPSPEGRLILQIVELGGCSHVRASIGLRRLLPLARRHTFWALRLGALDRERLGAGWVCWVGTVVGFYRIDSRPRHVSLLDFKRLAEISPAYTTIGG